MATHVAQMVTNAIICAALTALAQARPAAAQSTGNSDSSVDPQALTYANFNYSAGNTVDLPGPSVYQDGLDKGQAAGVAIGCVLGGLLLGALGALCWLKRRRLFPRRFGPPKHPDDMGPIASIDVIRTGSKLDRLGKSELVSPKSFIQSPHSAHAQHNRVPDVVVAR